MVKIRERKVTRFSPGSTASWLMLTAGMSWALTQSGVIPDLLNDLARNLGLGTANEYILMLIAGIPILIVATVALQLGTRHRHALQAFRDSEATLEGPNVLFLRPYFTDVKLPLLNPFYSAGAFNPDPAVGVGAGLKPDDHCVSASLPGRLGRAERSFTALSRSKRHVSRAAGWFGCAGLPAHAPLCIASGTPSQPPSPLGWPVVLLPDYFASAA
jgi:hypothetical protein